MSYLYLSYLLPLGGFLKLKILLSCFLTAIWLPHGQLSAILKGAASLIPAFLTISTQRSPGALQQVGSLL